MKAPSYNKCVILETFRIPRSSRQVNSHRIVDTEIFLTARAAARALRDEVGDALAAKDVTAVLENRVADVAVADGADGEAL